ncbi:hypothetical protein K490DRAFT_68576 [Saccharata proteae CBS 121410]|uniref:Uncharacterized protein n=1 Tax=Saccharata proteae CBS 121410 TaxID=1314787 RepID=A0A9P4LX49_9PEZI|nr:hypothetical protein K490DRAFT_68576 [Saccharata proteae CBS 121410]
MLALILLALLVPFALSHVDTDWHGHPSWPHHNKTSAPCSPRINALVAGIQINILGQLGERNATEAIQAIEAEVPINATAFAAGKAVLVGDIEFGMMIRKYNQELVPEGNGAVLGLEKYTQAQSQELDLANSLNADPTHDAPILSTLVSDVTTGIQLNKNNTLAAVSRCYSELVPRYDVPA